MRIKECFEEYRRQHLENNTVSPKRALRAWDVLSPHIGHLQTAKLKERPLQDYQRQRKWDGVSTTTINRELGVLRAALNWCFKQQLIDKVPYIPNQPSFRRRERVLTKQEVAQLMAAATTVPYVYKFFMLALFTGQRREAILGLTWDRVDMVRKTIEFNDPDLAMAARRKGRAHVPIHPKLFIMLEQLSKYQTCDYVVDNKGRDVPSTTLQYGWTKVRKLADLGPEVTPHIIRHTVATDQIGKGVSLEFVAQLLGHKSTHTTESVYVKRNPAHLVGTIDQMDY